MCEKEINLCDDCMHDVPTCPAHEHGITYGNGKGNDNIIKCKCHMEGEKEILRNKLVAVFGTTVDNTNLLTITDKRNIIEELSKTSNAIHNINIIKLDFDNFKTPITIQIGGNK